MSAAKGPGDVDRLGNSLPTRRLALNACESCRKRKAKCDEAQPQCGRCARLRLPCHYKELSVKKDPVLTHIRQSLERLESKIDILWGYLAKDGNSPLNGRDESTRNTSSTAHLPGMMERSTPTASQNLPPSSVSGPEAEVVHLPKERANHSFSSPPLRHSTAPENILSWPCVRARLPFMAGAYGLQGEIARHNSEDNDSSSASSRELTAWERILNSFTLSQIQHFKKAFFNNHYIYSPILAEAEFTDHILGPVLTGTARSEVNICIVVLVLLLGAHLLAELEWPGHSDDTQGHFQSLDPTKLNLQLSELTYRIRCNAEISWRFAQALLLAGLYYSQQVNLLLHWQTVHRACTVIMTLLQSNSHPTQNEIQIYWVAYFHESQILAEFEFPPSGIIRYEDCLPLPFSDGQNADETGSEYHMSFLAHLALRKLLNRIHLNIYGSDNSPYQNAFNNDSSSAMSGSSSLSAGFAPSLSIIQELDHQLENWRCHLPSALAFPSLDQMPPWQNDNLTSPRTASSHEKIMGYLKGRYCAAKSIILRPFLYRLLNSPEQESLSTTDQAGAKSCLLAVLQATLHVGLLRDSMQSIQMPLNPCRSFFAGAILLRLVHKRADLQWILPADWEVIHLIQERIENEASHLSPTISKDMWILRELDSIL